MAGKAKIKTHVRTAAKVVGKHVYGNLYGCNPLLLSDEEYLKKVVVEAAVIGNMTLLNVISWKFGGGGGVSVVAIVAESHISIHTWPEYSYATVDVYTCGEKCDPERAFHYIVSCLRPKKYTYHFVDRSLKPEDEEY
ncbi:MAG: adenosylmethionine decarboxylase [Thermoprotei archaeon]|nr:MAG: adenosylmethionine decarboxylase [Thermoprotei archaeon]